MQKAEGRRQKAQNQHSESATFWPSAFCLPPSAFSGRLPDQRSWTTGSANPPEVHPRTPHPRHRRPRPRRRSSRDIDTRTTSSSRATPCCAATSTATVPHRVRRRHPRRSPPHQEPGFSQVAQAACALRSKHRFVLTGTPMENSVRDLWSIMHFALPGYLGNRQDFRERYELPLSRPGDPAADAVRERLTRRLRPVLLRRLKKDVATELPDRIEQTSLLRPHSRASRGLPRPPRTIPPQARHTPAAKKTRARAGCSS